MTELNLTNRKRVSKYIRDFLADMEQEALSAEDSGDQKLAKDIRALANATYNAASIRIVARP
ncbi:DNA repair protein RecN [Roseibium sp. TrichSKD4]|uniref:hypothetical protein n=1 Tax=Roseibium sp. TrichSKD4 TaxID=744980 RepID=UPI0001E563F7|nr:hypothetical protein [Roseibium sp. TrichSKD4]EFO33941.1 DNA repair protein RecN [Roseibium sp. TrichSKD4]